jgi:hypothetical protein
MLKIHNSEKWAEIQVKGMPLRWRKRLLARWAESHGAALEITSGKGLQTLAIQKANGELLEIVERLQLVKLNLNASDAEICTRADGFALVCLDVGRVQHEIKTVRAGMAGFVHSCGLDAPGEKVKDRPAIARMSCRDWWRRGLRNLHAKAVESAAIQLGYVNRARDIYVSNESAARRQQQNKRNRLMMENTLMRNELEQEYTLAELAAQGTANKAIRRGELMTRIAGFERIALDCGHEGIFLTITCPSRMHKFNSAGTGKVYANPKYDGTTPRNAQGYLSACWARIRAAFKRAKLAVYGFRIAEPHHDACPHWHMLFFHETGRVNDLLEIVKKYMLADSPDEAGAEAHRVKAEVIDWSRGTAAGYIAKYVSKNIDGLHVESDLFGNPAMETSQRVEAWATTWGIRQFQQIGGAPVGVWRELRRVREVPANAPEHLKAAHAAVNKTGEKNADWAEYVMAQGGPIIGRKARISIAREQTGELGRYGEEKAPAPVGVVTVGGEYYRDGIVPDRFRLVEWLIHSVRHTWERVNRAGRSRAPRTCVNNCTRSGASIADEIGSIFQEIANYPGGVQKIPPGGGIFQGAAC